MRRREFIDMILNSISDTFDIYHNYWFEGRKFVIYAYSYNKKDRFSTTDDAKLWDSKCYEHLFFINCDTLGMKELDDLYDFAVNKIEPHFVRGDGKLPAKNHMYTHISFIIIKWIFNPLYLKLCYSRLGCFLMLRRNLNLGIIVRIICLVQEAFLISDWLVLPRADTV